MAIKIYTKTGDKGTTSLIGGTRVPKHDLLVETHGTVVELNLFVSLINYQITDQMGKEELIEIHVRLFTIVSALATDGEKEPKMKLPDLKDSEITCLEYRIDAITD